MSPAGRPRSAEAEQAILAATVELFTRRGLDAFSVESVAALAGVAKTTIYRRWPSKEELVLAAITALRADLPAPPGGSVRDDLEFLLRRIGSRSADGPWRALMTRLTVESADHPELAAEAWRRTVGPRRAVLEAVLRRGVAEGLIRPDADLGLVGDMLVAPVLGKVRPGRPALDDDQIGFVVDTVLGGLRTAHTP